MKKFILLFLTGLTTIGTLHAQTISSDEMFKLVKCADHECFKSYITTKGFTYFKTDDSEGNGTAYVYTADQLTGSTVSNMAKIFFPKDKTYTTVLLLTAVKSTFKSLLAEFKAKKFKVGEKSNVGGSVVTEYFSTDYPGYGMHVQIVKPKGESYTVYSIKLGYVPK